MTGSLRAALKSPRLAANSIANEKNGDKKRCNEEYRTIIMEVDV